MMIPDVGDRKIMLVAPTSATNIDLINPEILDRLSVNTFTIPNSNKSACDMLHGNTRLAFEVNVKC